jgi:hypothetical protein
MAEPLGLIVSDFSLSANVHSLRSGFLSALLRALGSALEVSPDGCSGAGVASGEGVG